MGFASPRRPDNTQGYHGYEILWQPKISVAITNFIPLRQRIPAFFIFRAPDMWYVNYSWDGVVGLHIGRLLSVKLMLDREGKEMSSSALRICFSTDIQIYHRERLTYISSALVEIAY